MNNNIDNNNPSPVKPVTNSTEYSSIYNGQDMQEIPTSKQKSRLQLMFKMLLLISPLLASILFYSLSRYTLENPGNLATGIGSLMVVLIGIPFVAITGLVCSIWTRNKPNAEVKSTYGYLVPAIITWLFAATLLFD